MKKSIFLLIAVLALTFGLCSCQSGNNTASKDSDKIKVVTTIFPEYDWVKAILGDKADKAQLTLLMDKGADLHNYQPSTSDIAKISEADLFIHVGGASDKWVEDVLKHKKNKNMQIINLMEVLGDKAKEEEIKEGMEDHDHDHDKDKDHDHDHDKDKDHDHDDLIEYDEHLWLSLSNAKLFCDKIAKALSQLDKENAETYQKNYEAYAKKIDQLNEEYEKVVASSPNKTLVFGDRFPFRYMVGDYGLDYYAAFIGCSVESEASFDTITFLAKKVDQKGLKSVITLENSNQKIAKSIIENTASKDQQILTMNSMQSVNEKDIKAGLTYLDIMKENLKVLKQALN